MCQKSLVPALDAGPQKNRPYQSVVYTVGFNAIPRQAREQDSFDTSLILLYVILLPRIKARASLADVGAELVMAQDFC